jgi:hypothetical protein
MLISNRTPLPLGKASSWKQTKIKRQVPGMRQCRKDRNVVTSGGEIMTAGKFSSTGMSGLHNPAPLILVKYGSSRKSFPITLKWWPLHVRRVFIIAKVTTALLPCRLSARSADKRHSPWADFFILLILPQTRHAAQPEGDILYPTFPYFARNKCKTTLFAQQKSPVTDDRFLCDPDRFRQCLWTWNMIQPLRRMTTQSLLLSLRARLSARSYLKRSVSLYP